MQAIYTATHWHKRMNKIPVYICIAILLGQVMLFSSEDSMNISSGDSEFDTENTALTSGRNHTEDAGWVIETVETSSSQGSWVEHGKYNSLAVDSNGKPHISYLSAIGTTYAINHTSFDGQTWNSNTVATSSGGPCSALDSSDSPHVGIYTSDSSGNADLKLATNTGQNSSSWTLEMIDNSSSNVGSNCEMKVGPNGDIYVVYWKWDPTNDSLKFAHHDGNSWTTSDIDNDGGSDSSLQIDTLGNLHVSYRDLTNGGLKYGINNGQGWVLSTIEGNGQGKGNSLVLDSNNDPHVSYFDSYNNRLKYASLTGTSWSISTVEAGLSWGNSSNAADTDTSIGIDSSDNVHISYYNAGLKYAFYDGTSWNFTLIDTVENIEGNTNLIVDDEQRIHISYHDKENKSLKYAYFQPSPTDPSNATAWFDGVSHSVTSSDTISISFDMYTDCECDYKVWAYLDVYLNGNKIDTVLGTEYTISDDESESDSVPWTATASGTYDFYLSLFKGEQGPTAVVNDVWIQSISLTVSLSDWQTSTLDTTFGNLGIHTSMAVDSDGDVHLAYYDGTNERIKYATNKGGSWNYDPIDAVGTATGVSIAVDSNDEVSVAYYDGSNGYLNYAIEQGGFWSVSTVDTSGNVGAYPSLAFDSNDKAHISYWDSTNNDLKYATDVSGSWAFETLESTGDVGAWSSIAIDSADAVHISYYDSTNLNLNYATDKNGLWNYSTVDWIGSVGSYSSLIVDSTDEIHISYYDDSNGALKYANDANGVWMKTTVDSGGLGTHTSIALDSNDDVHISYYVSGPNYDLKYATDSSGTWGSTIIDSNGNVGGFTSMAISSNDDIFIGYRDVTNQDLKMSFNLNFTANSNGGGEGNNTGNNSGNNTQPNPNDTDGDGVDNDEDSCEDGRPNWTSNPLTDFDSDGCQDSTEDWDDDNDGIDDAEDSCYLGDTNWDSWQENPVVDFDHDGCKDASEDLDDDNDGKMDSSDSCPLTRLGAVVDTDGCETSFPDDDGDGVSNDYDDCDDTDNGTIVDWRGCKVWEDQDNDGVHDDDDECPDTLEEIDVNSVGCVDDSSGGGNQTGNNTGGNSTGNTTENNTGGEEEPPVIEEEEDLLADDWYADIPVIGALIEQAQTKYGKYAGISVLSVTILGYVYRGLTMRSEYKMAKRVKRFKKQINKAESAKELRRIQSDIEHADDRRLLPRGSLGDLLSLIELRAEDLGLTDFITQDTLIEAGITQDELMAGVDALNQARDDLASAQFEADKASRRSSTPSISQRKAPSIVATATLRGSAKGGGVKRPSYHPKDLNRDGSVDDEDERIWAEMSESERDAKRRESARKDTNIASQVVAFSKLPPSLKSHCHCGKKKAYFKCHFKKDKCPCGSGKKFHQCCAKSRGY